MPGWMIPLIMCRVSIVVPAGRPTARNAWRRFCRTQDKPIQPPCPNSSDPGVDSCTRRVYHPHGGYKFELGTSTRLALSPQRVY